MKNSLQELLLSEKTFPIMGEALNPENTMEMDFSPANTGLMTCDFSDTKSFDHFVFDKLRAAGKKYGIGGYLEHRAIYARSEVFVTDQSDFRNIHLGIDIWTEAGHPVFAPLSGKVFSFQNNAGFGDYGPTIILEHELKGKKIYSLYGHLARKDLKGLDVGMTIPAGKAFCHVGPYPENGDWPPHLHFQLMWDMMGNWGDFPGVCSQREIEKYRAICPDPQVLTGYSPM